MKTINEFLLTFLLNAFWQIALITAAAAFGDWLLRRTVVRYRHALWVVALGLSLVVPLVTSVRQGGSSAAAALPPQQIALEPIAITDLTSISEPSSTAVANSNFQINQSVAIGLLALYLMFLGYRGVQLFRAWARTQAARQDAIPIGPADRIQAIVASCQQAIGVGRVSVVSSGSLRAPATIGILRPLVILPDALVRDAGAEALTAAIGHELVHVWRRDYLLNLIYEIILLPLSFHPAAALMRRRITQTRELRCDELVAELLLHPEVYARSLVQLAGSAMPFARRARTVTVGIADADILEVRIMSLLKRTNLHTGRRRFLLIAAALLLVIPCAAAGVFAFHLNIGTASAQEPSSAAKEKREMEGRARMEQERAKEDQELRERIDTETNQEIKAKLQAILERRLEERAKGGYKIEFGQNDKTEFRLVNGEGAAREREQETKQQAQLASLARISMDRAIQIAVSQTPGKVFECSLVGEHWDGTGESAKPGLVLYHVVILTGDDAQPTRAHVLVNAFDGTIFRADKEERRRVNIEGEQRLKVELEPLMTSSGERRAINGGVLNGKATAMPPPEYPVIAKAAHASGAVTVEIVIDENGAVVAAHAVDGHPLLQAAAVNAARQATFTPTRLSGEPVKVNGVLIYNFVAQ
jgi:TonB family protein